MRIKYVFTAKYLFVLYLWKKKVVWESVLFFSEKANAFLRIDIHTNTHKIFSGIKT